MKKIKINEKDFEKLIKSKAKHYEGHTREYTRRQFLAQLGITTSAAYFALNNLPNLIVPKEAIASSGIVSPTNLPYFSLECGGGISLAGNVVIGRDKSGTQNFYGDRDGYLAHGIPTDYHPSASGMTDESYGIKFHTKGGIFIGMEQILKDKKISINGTDTNIKDMVDGLVILYRSTDDTNTNPISATIPAVITGSIGGLVNLIGNTGQKGGGHHDTDPAIYNARYNAVRIQNAAQAEGILSLNSSFPAINRPDSSKTPYASRDFMQRAARIARDRIQMIANSSNKKISPELESALNASYKESGDLFEQFTPTLLNPNLADASTLSAVFPKTISTNPFIGNLEDDKDLLGTLCHLLFHDSPSGNTSLAGVASLEVPGCDYHDGTASLGMKKDLEIGRYIGEVIYYAALKGKSVVIDVISDGSAIGSGNVIDNSELGNGKLTLVTDSPISSGSLMIVYNHGKTRAAHPIVKSDSNGSLRQIGHFVNVKNGSIDLTANTVANNIKELWKVKMLNYIALTSETDSPREIIDRFEEKFFRGLLGSDAQSMIRFKYKGA